uniref:Uncharacterized protein n=1 Tax=Lactuca sativa TaxID=4236 RepID=A0A9R1UMI5_LACSA|nr:hypothetical protein LSAT_V11C800416030 [Lactuca sativa]
MGWFFLSQVTTPNPSTVKFYYQTEVLNLEPSLLGTSCVIGWMGLLFGTFIYNRFLKKIKLRKLLTLSHVILSLTTLLDIALVSRLNVRFDISDEAMVLFGSALSDAIHQFKVTPFLILSGYLCPPEGQIKAITLSFSIRNLHIIFSMERKTSIRAILGSQESTRNSQHQLMILLLQNLGSVMADVVIDAMIADAARREKYVLATSFYSLHFQGTL